MMAQVERSSALMRNLQDALTRDPVAPVAGAPAYNRLRLQPVAVPEPRFTSKAVVEGHYGAPQQPAADLPPVSAEDDLPLDEVMSDGQRSRRSNLMLASAVALAGATAIATFVYFLSPQQPASRPVQEIKADPSALTKAPEPAPKTSEAAQAATAPPKPAEVVVATPAGDPVSMGQVSTELVAPSTEGLTPARRIETLRIMVEGDREVPARR